MDEGFCVKVNYEFIKDNDRNCQERKIRIFHSFLIRPRFYGYISEPELYKCRVTSNYVLYYVSVSLLRELGKLQNIINSGQLFR